MKKTIKQKAATIQPMPVRGYKVTDKNMQCRGYQYELNKVFVHDGEISMCNGGFHFCINAAHCFNYYSFSRENRVFEIEAYGPHIIHGDDKSCTAQLKFLRELTWEEVLKLVNTGVDNTGFGNSGSRNSGSWNSGDSNSGDSNSGSSNSGSRNSGSSNSGSSNSGSRNSGSSNSGSWNSGSRNSGSSNSGSRNSGSRNSGSWNSGSRNSGSSNSGSRNSGSRNSGSWNSGSRNSGDSNSGSGNTGIFCTTTDDERNIEMFNKPSDWTYDDWKNSRARSLMSQHLDMTIWVPESAMSDKEKEEHPYYKCQDGYLKKVSMQEAWKNMWHNLNDIAKQAFTSLPNFDKKIFKEITGIKL